MGYSGAQAPGEHLFMKKIWCRKSRVRLPLTLPHAEDAEDNGRGKSMEEASEKVPWYYTFYVTYVHDVEDVGCGKDGEAGEGQI